MYLALKIEIKRGSRVLRNSERSNTFSDGRENLYRRDVRIDVF